MSNSLIDTAENNTKLVPELRFPEFENGSEWVVKELKEIFISFSGGTPSTTNQNFYGGNIPFIRSAEIGKDKTELFLTEEGLKNSSAKLVNKGDLLIALYGANSGDVAISKLKGAINQAILCMQSDYSNTFTFNFLSLKKNWIISKYIQGGQGNLSGDIVKSIKLAFPIKLEQEKIASCLSSLDELITANREKLEALQAHKKGLMQNLFPLEGQTAPNYRFPEFEDDGEWERKTVELLIKENILFPPKDGNHGNIHPKSSDYVKSGIPFIMASNLKNGNIDFDNCAYLTKEHADSLQKGFAKSGDVLLTHKGTVGEVALLGEIEFPYIMLTPQVTYYRIQNKSKLTNVFLAAFFNSDAFQKNLLKVSGGGTRAYVGITNQKDFEIHFPQNIKEQQKIASCLSEADKLITAQTAKIEHLQQHKKGLMQGLFPKNLD